MADERKAIRTAIKTFLAPPAVPGLNAVYRGMPKVIDAKDYRVGQPAGTQSGAVGVIHLRRDFEERRAVGGVTSGKKKVSYLVELNVFFHSIRPKSEEAVDDFDAIIDAIKQRLRAGGRTLDDPTNIFEAGEEQLESEQGDPEIEGDSTLIWGVVRFVVSQILTT